MPAIMRKRDIECPPLRRPRPALFPASIVLILFVPCGALLGPASHAQNLSMDRAADPGGRVLRLWEHLDANDVRLESKGALIVDEFGNELYAKDVNTPRPLASIMIIPPKLKKLSWWKPTMNFSVLR